MTPFEYILALVSILVGLAVADLATCLHHLLRARRRVRWDWLPLAAALLVGLLILNFWWAFYGIGRSAAWTHYGAFLVLGASLVTLFLLASATLPDGVPAEGLDLRAYYHDNAGYFWTLFAAFLVLSSGVYAAGSSGRLGAEDLPRTVPNLVLAALLLGLGRARSRRAHAVAVPLLLVLLGLMWSRMRLG